MKTLEKFFTDYGALVTLSERVKLAQIEDGIAEAEKEFGSLLENAKTREELDFVCAKLAEYPQLLKNHPEHVSKFIAFYRRTCSDKSFVLLDGKEWEKSDENRVTEILMLHQVASSVDSGRFTRAVQKETRYFFEKLVNKYHQRALEKFEYLYFGNLRPLMERGSDLYNKTSLYLLAMLYLYWCEGRRDDVCNQFIINNKLSNSYNADWNARRGCREYMANSEEVIGKFFVNYKAYRKCPADIKASLVKIKEELIREFCGILQESCQTQRPLAFGYLCKKLKVYPELLETEEVYCLFLSAYKIFKTKRPRYEEIVEEYVEVANGLGALAEKCPRLKEVADREARSVFLWQIKILLNGGSIYTMSDVSKKFLPSSLQKEWVLLASLVSANAERQYRYWNGD